MGSTGTKIRIARILVSILLLLGLKPRRRIRRNRLAYDVDIREGIDLSLFLVGTFQPHLLRLVRSYVPADGIVIDVGANVGAITMPLAQHVARGHVYAFEPTEYAHEKLRRNLGLNPHLLPRVTLIKSFVADTELPISERVAYSSWPLRPDESAGRHPVHGGAAKPAVCPQTALDVFVRERALDRLSLIKIDTDGQEFAVLSGATECLRRFRPLVLFEACEYLMRPPRPTFLDFARLFDLAGYTVLDIKGRPLNEDGFLRACPTGGGMDLQAVANERLPRINPLLAT